jgi:hypothetical protein
MSNKQARATKKLVLKRIVLTFEDGTATMLDPAKVDIVDRVTRKPLFKVEEPK